MFQLRSSVAQLASLMVILLPASYTASPAAQAPHAQARMQAPGRPEKPRSWWKRAVSGATAGTTNKPSAGGAAGAPPSWRANTTGKRAASCCSRPAAQWIAYRSLEKLRCLWAHARFTGSRTVAKAGRRLRLKPCAKPCQPPRLYRLPGDAPSSPPSVLASAYEAPSCRVPSAEVLVEVSLASDVSLCSAKGAGEPRTALVAIVPLCSVHTSPADGSKGAKRVKAAMAKAAASTRKLAAAMDMAQARLAAKLKATAAPMVSTSQGFMVKGGTMAASLRRRLEPLSSMGRRDSGGGKDHCVGTATEA